MNALFQFLFDQIFQDLIVRAINKFGEDTGLTKLAARVTLPLIMFALSSLGVEIVVYALLIVSGRVSPLSISTIVTSLLLPVPLLWLSLLVVLVAGPRSIQGRIRHIAKMPMTIPFVFILASLITQSVEIALHVVLLVVGVLLSVLLLEEFYPGAVTRPWKRWISSTLVFILTLYSSLKRRFRPRVVVVIVGIPAIIGLLFVFGQPNAAVILGLLLAGIGSLTVALWYAVHQYRIDSQKQ